MGWRVDSAPEICYTESERSPPAHVGAIGFDGAHTDARLREEVVGTLSKPPATHKCQHWHAHGCLKRGSHVRPDSPAGSGSGVTTRASRPVGRERRRRTHQSRLGPSGSCRSEPPRPRSNRPTTRVDVSWPGHPDVGSIPTASTISLRSNPSLVFRRAWGRARTAPFSASVEAVFVHVSCRHVDSTSGPVGPASLFCLFPAAESPKRPDFRIRFERRADIDEAFLSLGGILICRNCLRRL